MSYEPAPVGTQGRVLVDVAIGGPGRRPSPALEQGSERATKRLRVIGIGGLVANSGHPRRKAAEGQSAAECRIASYRERFTNYAAIVRGSREGAAIVPGLRVHIDRILCPRTAGRNLNNLVRTRSW